MTGNRKDHYKDVIIAATVWACCPSVGSYADDGERGGASVEDTCEGLSFALARLNGGKRLPELDRFSDAIALGEKLAGLPR
jgi:hypothetical protein